MKGVFWVFVLLCVTISSCKPNQDKQVTQAGGDGLTNPSKSQSPGQRVLKVVLPESTTVRLTAGSSYTGKLTAFNPTNLIISANDASQKIPLTQIKQVEFQGNVWIPNPDGKTSAIPIRGLPIFLERVPVGALELSGSSNAASLNLASVLTAQEFKKFSSHADQIHVVTKILFEPSNVMKVTVKTVRR